MKERQGDKVIFDAVDDKDIFVIKNESGLILAELKGYDIDIVFNLDVVKSEGGIDQSINGIAQVFEDYLKRQIEESM